MNDELYFQVHRVIYWYRMDQCSENLFGEMPVSSLNDKTEKAMDLIDNEFKRSMKELERLARIEQDKLDEEDNETQS